MPSTQENESMVSVDQNLLIRTMKSSSSSTTTMSKPTSSSNKNLKWRWNKIKDKIKNKHSYDSSHSMMSGDTETMITKTTMDDDDIHQDMSFCSQSTTSVQYHDTEVDGSNETTPAEYLKLMETPSILANESIEINESNEQVNLVLSKSKSVESVEEDNISSTSSENNIVLYDENNSAVLPTNASEIFSYNNEIESYYGPESICDYRYIKRTKSFIGSEVFSLCGGPNSVRNSCSDEKLPIGSGDVIITENNPMPSRFRFTSGDYMKNWNFGTSTNTEMNDKSLLDELSDDEGDDDVHFLPINDIPQKRKRDYPIVAVASNKEGGIEAVNFDECSYKVSANVEDMDSYDIPKDVEEQASLHYQNSSFFNCGLEFCKF